MALELHAFSGDEAEFQASLRKVRAERPRVDRREWTKAILARIPDHDFGHRVAALTIINALEAGVDWMLATTHAQRNAADNPVGLPYPVVTIDADVGPNARADYLDGVVRVNPDYLAEATTAHANHKMQFQEPLLRGVPWLIAATPEAWVFGTGVHEASHHDRGSLYGSRPIPHVDATDLAVVYNRPHETVAERSRLRVLQAVCPGSVDLRRELALLAGTTASRPPRHAAFTAEVARAESVAWDAERPDTIEPYWSRLGSPFAA